jgi:hypothetical protein
MTLRRQAHGKKTKQVWEQQSVAQNTLTRPEWLQLRVPYGPILWGTGMEKGLSRSDYGALGRLTCTKPRFTTK